ncbi:DNA repair protein RadC [soil metagenome]
MLQHFTFRDQVALLPREKITQLGIQALSTEELLHAILGSGSKNQTIEKLAKIITKKIQSSKKLEMTDLLSVKGMGEAKACQILAAVELVERMRPLGFPLMNSLARVLEQLSELRYLPREKIMCLYLNTRMQLLLKETLAIGSVNQSVIAPRDIFSVIKYHPVSYLILSHNHPSGVALPSAEDIIFTESIQEAGHLLGVELLDHVILAKEEHYSFREQKKMS